MAMTLRTDAELDAALDRLAAAEGRSRQDVIRRLVLERANQLDRQARLREVSQQGLKKWADVYEQLAEM